MAAVNTNNSLFWSCCGDLYNMDFSKVGLPGDWDVWCTVLYIVTLPIIWNLVIVYESRGGYFSRILGTPQRGVVFLAVTLIITTIARDLRYSAVVRTHPHWYLLQENSILWYSAVVRTHPHWYLLQENSILWSGYGVMLLGFFLIVASYRASGFYHFFFGEYFGLGCDHPLGFPYNVCDHPTYIGSTFSFLGLALVYASWIGLLLTVLVALTYTVSGFCEESLQEEMLKRRALLQKEKVS